MSPSEPKPDFYADAVQVAVGNFGVTLSLLLSDPESPDTLGVLQARVRLSPDLARAVTKILTESFDRADAAAAASPAPTPSTEPMPLSGKKTK